MVSQSTPTDHHVVVLDALSQWIPSQSSWRSSLATLVGRTLGTARRSNTANASLSSCRMQLWITQCWLQEQEIDIRRRFKIQRCVQSHTIRRICSELPMVQSGCSRWRRWRVAAAGSVCCQRNLSCESVDRLGKRSWSQSSSSCWSDWSRIGSASGSAGFGVVGLYCPVRIRRHCWCCFFFFCSKELEFVRSLDASRKIRFWNFRHWRQDSFSSATVVRGMVETFGWTISSKLFTCEVDFGAKYWRGECNDCYCSSLCGSLQFDKWTSSKFWLWIVELDFSSVACFCCLWIWIGISVKSFVGFSMRIRCQNRSRPHINVLYFSQSSWAILWCRWCFTFDRNVFLVWTICSCMFNSDFFCFEWKYWWIITESGQWIHWIGPKSNRDCNETYSSNFFVFISLQQINFDLWSSSFHLKRSRKLDITNGAKLYVTCCQWQLSWRVVSSRLSTRKRSFSNWIELFQKVCGSKQCHQQNPGLLFCGRFNCCISIWISNWIIFGINQIFVIFFFSWDDKCWWGKLGDYWIRHCPIAMEIFFRFDVVVSQS